MTGVLQTDVVGFFRAFYHAYGMHVCRLLLLHPLAPFVVVVLFMDTPENGVFSFGAGSISLCYEMSSVKRI
jgi:hypothetical protein